MVPFPLWLGAVLFGCIGSGGASKSETSKILDLYSQMLMIKPLKPAENHVRTNKLGSGGREDTSLAAGYHGVGIPAVLERIKRARTKALATRSAIRAKWALGDEFESVIDEGVGFSPGSTTDQLGAFKYDHKKVRDGPARAVLVGKLLRAVVTDDRAFTVAFAGTSVSAGHDNWFNQSHPHAYERAFRPAFKAAGGELVVRNHAMGGNSITPSHFCAAAQLDGFGPGGASDLDLAVYEFAMIANRDDCRFESFARSVLLLPRNPAFMAYTTSGVGWRETTDEVPEKGKYGGPKLLTKQTCNRKWVVEYYAAQGAHFGDLARLSHAMGHLPQFTSVQMMGEKAGPRAKAIHGGAAPTRASVALGVEDDDAYNRGGSARTGGGGGGGGGGSGVDERRRRLAPYHPGPGAHAWQGQMLAHAHLGLLLEALDVAESAASKVLSDSGFVGGGGGPAAGEALVVLLEKRWDGGRGKGKHGSFPPPIGCHEPYCGAGRAQCFSTYTPRAPAADLASLVVTPGGGPVPSMLGDPGDGRQQRPLPEWVLALPPGADFEKHASFG